MSQESLSRRTFFRLGAVSAAAAATVIAPVPRSISTRSAGPATPAVLPLAKAYGADVLIRWVDEIYDLVRRERFSPPSAARAYGYVAVAAYEAVVAGMPAHRPLAGQLNGLTAVPAPPRSTRLHWPLVLNATVEQAALAVFSNRSAESRAAIGDHAAAQRSLLAAAMTQRVVDASHAHGRAVGQHLARWIHGDGYAGILGLPYAPPVGPGLWERTPPTFGLAVEPHWELVRPMALASVDACAPRPPLSYSAAADSPFWNQAKAVYQVSSDIGDGERAIALFWRDSGDGTTGLPSGHWMLIASRVIQDRQLDLAAAAEALAMVGISLADGFTSCWTEKYRTNVLRPVTYIRDHIDPAWSPFVDSPPFPEYTSGHSVGSGAAAATLTSLFGDAAFVDDTGARYGRETRSYRSFTEAADEAAISRLWGGIHYPMAIDEGLEQGRVVSQVVRDAVKTRIGADRS